MSSHAKTSHIESLTTVKQQVSNVEKKNSCDSFF